MVDNHDNPMMPTSTFRAWFIGTIFVAAGYVLHSPIAPCQRTSTNRLSCRGFINQFFSIRQPGITVSANVAQLLAFPAGKLLEAILPSKRFTTFGHTWNLNPGKFNLKEHMVITVMANVGFSTPYTSNVRLFEKNRFDQVQHVTRAPQIIWVQYLPLYFNQAYASNFEYQSVYPRPVS